MQKYHLPNFPEKVETAKKHIFLSAQDCEIPELDLRDGEGGGLQLAISYEEAAAAQLEADSCFFRLLSKAN